MWCKCGVMAGAIENSSKVELAKTNTYDRENPMAEDSMAFVERMKQQGGGDFLRSLVEAVLAELMNYEVASQIGAELHERNGERQAYQNGYRERTLHSRLGTLELRVPKLRQGTYFPSFLKPRRLSEQAIAAVVQEAWINGVSTRKVDELVQALGMTGISKSQVSELCRGIDERVDSFLNRPIEGEWPYLWLDATYLKVRQGGRVVSVATIVACAVNQDGRREILGLGIGESEAKEFWLAFLRGLRQRGPERRQAGDFRRARGTQGGHRAGVLGELATVPRALHAQPPGLRAEGQPIAGRHVGAAGLCAARSRQRSSCLAAGRRSSAATL